MMLALVGLALYVNTTADVESHRNGPTVVVSQPNQARPSPTDEKNQSKSDDLIR